jgi:putative FmdB family regulatory protein
VPTYDYACAACGHRFEVIHGVHAPGPDTCPNCGQGPVRKAIAAPTVVYKGSGWAKLDRRESARPAAAKTGATSGESAPSPATSSESSSNSDSNSDSSSDSGSGSMSSKPSGDAGSTPARTASD